MGRRFHIQKETQERLLQNILRKMLGVKLSEQTVLWRVVFLVVPHLLTLVSNEVSSRHHVVAARQLRGLKKVVRFLRKMGQKKQEHTLVL